MHPTPELTQCALSLYALTTAYKSGNRLFKNFTIFCNQNIVKCVDWKKY